MMGYPKCNTIGQLRKGQRERERDLKSNTAYKMLGLRTEAALSKCSFPVGF